MNVERPMLSATIPILAAVLAAFDAHAQMSGTAAADRSGGALSEAVSFIDGRSSLFAGGREVRLAATQTLLPVPGEVAASLAARSAKTLIPHEVDLRVLGAKPDRYGRLVAYAFARMP